MDPRSGDGTGAGLFRLGWVSATQPSLVPLFITGTL
jgi:hypothetical protein